MTSEDQKKSDTGLLAMINSVLSGKSPVSPSAPEPAEVQPPTAEPPISEPPELAQQVPDAEPGGADLPEPVTGRRRLTVEQMESVIRKVLTELPEFGNGGGTQIIVYGYHPWNALVLFEASAVSSEDARAIKQAVEIAVETLRRDYDIVMPTS